MSSRPKLSGTLSALLLTTACAGFNIPDNLELVAQGQGYQAQYREPDVTFAETDLLRSEAMNAQKCLPLGGTVGIGSSIAASVLRVESLSRNDLLDVRIAEDDIFNGSYVVSRDGMLKLPFLHPIRAQGRSTDQVEADILNALLVDKFYQDPPRISVRVTDFGSISVGVSGAVFEPHGVEIGGVRGDVVDSRRQMASGASGRTPPAARKAADRLRPSLDAPEAI